MINKEQIFAEIDDIIKTIDQYKNIELFDVEKGKRKSTVVTNIQDNNGFLKKLSYLIAFSQNANSKNVEQVLQSGHFDKAFRNFIIEEVVKLNPCDVADEYWDLIKGMRQQTKIFQIVTLARKIDRIGSFSDILNKTKLPKTITTKKDIDDFWTGFNQLLKILKTNKIPFFQSTTSLLHLLMDMGYDCVKPDLVVMKVAKKLNIVDDTLGDKNLRETVRFIQEYSIDRKIRPSIVDFYFLINGGQMGAKKFVIEKDYYA